LRLHSAAGLLLLRLLESLVRSIEQKSAGSHPNIQSKESPSPFGCSLRLAFWPSIRRRSFEPTPPFLRRFVLAFNFFSLSRCVVEPPSSMADVSDRDISEIRVQGWCLQSRIGPALRRQHLMRAPWKPPFPQAQGQAGGQPVRSAQGLPPTVTPEIGP
jgi:hypothetical protein